MPELLPIFALDVSSTMTGYALLSACGDLMKVGRFRPIARESACERIDFMAEQSAHSATVYVGWFGPIEVVMEWSDGKTHGRLAKASGLSTLGAAQGAVRQALRSAGFEVVTVGENEWTRRVPKPERAERMALAHPKYREFRGESRVTKAGIVWSGDSGLDAADALGIADWWRGERQKRALMAMGKGMEV